MNDPLRIAYAAQVPLPSHRAHAVHVMHMCKAFAELGHQATLYAMPPTETADSVHGFYGMAPDFEVEHVPMSRLRGVAGPLFGRAIAARARAAGCDLFYSRHIYAAAFAHAAGLPVIFEAHQPVSNALHRRLLARMLKDRAGFDFVVITAALRDRYLADFPGLAADRVIVAHDAADLPVVAPSLLPPPQGLRDGAIREGEFRAGYVGNLYPGKGIELILEVAGALPQVPFEIVGGRPEDLAHWKAQSSPANVVFRGQVPHGDLQGHFDRMDVLLLPLQHRVSPDGGSADISQWTSPMKMFEYMAQGKPIIASDLPVLQEVLTGGTTALIAGATDTDAWAAAIRRLQADAPEAARLGEAAKSLLEREHTWIGRAGQVLASAQAYKRAT